MTATRCDCQKLTYTFVAHAIHTLQRMYREWNEREREFLQEVGTDTPTCQRTRPD
jgi:hypothetical protein